MKEAQPVRVRNFEQSDRLDVVTLIEESGLMHTRPQGYIQGEIDQRKILVAESVGSVIGTVVMSQPAKDGSANIKYVAVHENFRNLGIGKIMMSHAESFLRGLNVKAINILAHEAKPELISYYGKLGFVLVSDQGEMVKRFK